ncbi:DUF3048 domain-containing protein [Auraticoccus monumenti]|uniref:DUF3048 domain-containing protein n=1 Tax=Auraticoccus monumenti TaxID=675864 RepID=A0A1G7CBF5_9ACTN|nr:DUF3048 domain-containing protein [Auraticoccus monumenti]SDE36553.1 Protein of unknown function [Auraticoccus monumenti]
MQLKRPQTIGLAVAAAVVVAAVVVAVALGGRGPSAAPATPGPAPSSAAPSPSATPTPSPSPTPEPEPVDPLTGEEVVEAEVFAVKIDNLAPARPQLGLSSADIVVAEEVEAGLSRLVAVFHTEFPDRVGPVRSARNTDVELLPLFGEPGLVYSGANSKVQANVRGSKHLVPIERSDRDSTRPAPHNVVVDLGALAKQHEVGEARDIGWEFGDQDDAWDGAEDSDDLAVGIGGDDFTFERRDDRYQPAVNGDPYTDGGDAVLVDNVVVLSVRNRDDEDTTSSQSIVSETTGKGKVEVTREGRTLTGTWRRDEVEDPMTFTDEDGEPMLLKPGSSWVLLKG